MHPASSRSPVRAQRYEFKYLVSELQAHRIARSAAPFVRPDPYAQGRVDHTYPICSLYLDADQLLLYRETIEGKTTRYKLRVRSYSDDPQTPVFLEVKRRTITVVRKTRCTVARELLPAILAGRHVPLPEDREQAAALADFTRLMLTAHARPKLLVRYDRQAWVGAEDDALRITFDRRLAVLPTERAEVLLETPRFRPIATRGVVLELKFDDRCPSWLLQLVRSCGLNRTSYSKYCNAVDCIGAADLAQLT